jgi:hypothetical protein
MTVNCGYYGQPLPEDFKQPFQAIKEAFQAEVEERDGWGEVGYAWKKDFVEIPGIQGHVRRVEEHGGMDMGSDKWVVFSVTNGDSVRHFKISGHYESHHGTDWDDDSFTEVQAIPKTIHVWEPTA